MERRFNASTAHRAASESPTLAGLIDAARDSARRLEAVADLIPPDLRPTVLPGPVEGVNWCLLVPGNAAAAKLRQLAPDLLARLRAAGWNTELIRIKIRSRR